jgi:hypothetical protein
MTVIVRNDRVDHPCRLAATPPPEGNDRARTGLRVEPAMTRHGFFLGRALFIARETGLKYPAKRPIFLIGLADYRMRNFYCNY